MCTSFPIFSFLYLTRESFGIRGVILGGLFVILTTLRLSIVILAVSVSVGIGLFFGFYPAWNASRLNPIDALRSD